MISSIDPYTSYLVIQADKAIPLRYQSIDFMCEFLEDTTLNITDFSGPEKFIKNYKSYKITVSHNNLLSVYTIGDDEVYIYTCNGYIVLPPYTKQTIYVPRRIKPEFGSRYGIPGDFYTLKKKPSIEQQNDWQQAGCECFKQQRHMPDDAATWVLFVPKNIYTRTI